MIISDCRVGIKKIAESLNILNELVFNIIHVNLDMKKIPAKWVPKCLNFDQKRSRVLTSKDILVHFAEDSSIFWKKNVTMDETWVHYYNPETKQQFIELLIRVYQDQKVQDSKVLPESC